MMATRHTRPRIPVSGRRALIACTGIVSGLWVPYVEAAQWSAESSVRGGFEYHENLLLRTGDVDQVIGSNVDLSARLAWRTESRELWAAPRLRFLRYEEMEALDSDDQFLDLGCEFRRERAAWGLSASLARDSTLTSELEDTGFVSANKRHERASMTASGGWNYSERGQLGVLASAQEHRYLDAVNTGLVDYQYANGAVWMSYALSERSRGGAQLSWGSFEVESPGADTTDQAARLTFAYAFAPHLRLNITGGRIRVASTGRSEQGTAYSIELQREGELTDWRLSAERDVSPSGRGVLVRRDDFVMTLGRHLTARLHGDLSLKHIVDRDLVQGLPGADRDYQRGEARVDWRADQNWVFTGFVSYTRQSYANSPDIADGTSCGVSILWMPRRVELSR
jgi:hypothetical protein